MAREGVLLVAFRAHKNILASLGAKAALTASFRGMRFIFSHDDFLL
jgi:hypothetical protein